MIKLTGILLVIAVVMAVIDVFFDRRRIRPRGGSLNTADLGRGFMFSRPGLAIDGLSKSLAGGRAVDGKNDEKGNFDANALKSKI